MNINVYMHHKVGRYNICIHVLHLGATQYGRVVLGYATIAKAPFQSEQNPCMTSNMTDED